METPVEIRNSVRNDGFTKLKVRDRVSLAEKVGDKCPQASAVKPMSKHSLKI